MDTAPVTDEQIVAFLDDALSSEEQARIALAVANDPSVAARIEALALDRDDLRAGFEDMLSEAPVIALPPEPANQPQQPSGWGVWGLRGAAAAAIFAIGIGAGSLLTPPTEVRNDWTTAVADYQVLYATETLTTTPLSDAARELSLARTSAALGLDLSEEALSVDGLDFQRAQILSYMETPLAQLAFLDADGTPFALCFLRLDGGDTEPRTEDLAGLASVTWQQDGFGFILIGGDDPAAVEALQKQFAGRIGS
ncbi:MAG: hypothetical protein AAGD13_21155 [Pseudomonadota bacterium]